MNGLDTTALVQLADRQHLSHSAVLQLTQKELESANALIVTPQVAAEFLHVITDSRRFTSPLIMTQALDWI
jgi:predicted nucleic acid-binding protein